VVRQRIVRRGDLADFLRDRLLQDPLEIVRLLALAGASHSTDAELNQLDVTLRLELREAVTSPGGTTAAALAVLMAEDGLPALMKRAVAAAHSNTSAPKVRPRYEGVTVGTSRL
jgi:hypothetical protein